MAVSGICMDAKIQLFQKPIRVSGMKSWERIHSETD